MHAATPKPLQCHDHCTVLWNGSCNEQKIIPSGSGFRAYFREFPPHLPISKPALKTSLKKIDYIWQRCKPTIVSGTGLKISSARPATQSRGGGAFYECFTHVVAGERYMFCYFFIGIILFLYWANFFIVWCIIMHSNSRISAHVRRDTPIHMPTFPPMSDMKLINWKQIKIC